MKNKIFGIKVYAHHIAIVPRTFIDFESNYIEKLLDSITQESYDKPLAMVW